VLVSTEVGSEGLDFQFCHFLVNYDLPWNPMVVDQRIGRIDRFGQESKVVHIISLVASGTVDERILAKLYERIGLFKRSIGALNTILGETVNELAKEFISGELTPAEAERRVDEAASAIQRREIQSEDLERRAGELFGHDEYIRGEMDRVKRLGRYITHEALVSLVEGYLAAKHPNVSLKRDADGVVSVRLTAELRRELRSTAAKKRVDRDWIERERGDRLFLTTDGAMANRRPDLDLLNVGHPLVAAAVQASSELLVDAVARAGKATLRLTHDEERELPDGVVFTALFAHDIDGMRRRRVLDCVAWSTRDEELMEPELAERLLHLVIESGREWERGSNAPPLTGEVLGKIESEARRRSKNLREVETDECEALFIRRERALQAEYDHRARKLEQKIKTARTNRREERIVRLFEAQLDKQRDRLSRELERLSQCRAPRLALSEPLAICAVEVRRAQASNDG